MRRILIVAAVFLAAAACSSDEPTPSESPQTDIGQQIDQSRDTVDEQNRQTEQREQDTGTDQAPYTGGG